MVHPDSVRGTKQFGILTAQAPYATISSMTSCSFRPKFWVRILLFVPIFLTSPLLWARDFYDGPRGGVVLDFPQGRFQENLAPNYFKWTLQAPAKTLTLKIYRKPPSGKINPTTDLIQRFDLMGDVDSLTWDRPRLPYGQYLWLVESYDDKNPLPIYVDSTEFEVEELKNLDLRTSRISVIAGFSRGEYTSSDATYSLNFTTAPTNYGINITLGQPEKIWNTQMVVNDMTLRGSIYRTMSLETSYLQRWGARNRYSMDFFWGPSLRAFQFPRVRTLNGTDLHDDTITTANPGLALAVQKQIDLNISLFSKTSLDFPVYGSQSLVSDADGINFNISAGMNYRLFWPLGVSGEVQYRMDRAKTKDGNNEILAEISSVSMLINLIYIF